MTPNPIERCLHPVRLASLYIGQRVKYNGHEYQVMNYGPWGVRIESGYGRQHCILVVPAYELESAEH